MSKVTVNEFILIPNGPHDFVSYPVNELEEIHQAETALAEADLDWAYIYVGDPDGDHHRNGKIIARDKKD